MNPQDAMKEYESAKLEIRKLEEKCKELQPIFITLVPDDKNIVTERGYFYIQKRPTWKFSQTVKKAEEDLDKMKEDEKARGDAEVTYKSVLYYKEGAPKEVEAE